MTGFESPRILPRRVRSAFRPILRSKLSLLQICTLVFGAGICPEEEEYRRSRHLKPKQTSFAESSNLFPFPSADVSSPNKNSNAFVTTQWTRVLQARGETAEASLALSE